MCYMAIAPYKSYYYYNDDDDDDDDDIRYTEQKNKLKKKIPAACLFQRESGAEN